MVGTIVTGSRYNQNTTCSTHPQFVIGFFLLWKSKITAIMTLTSMITVCCKAIHPIYILFTQNFEEISVYKIGVSCHMLTACINWLLMKVREPSSGKATWPMQEVTRYFVGEFKRRKAGWSWGLRRLLHSKGVSFLRLLFQKPIYRLLNRIPKS